MILEDFLVLNPIANNRIDLDSHILVNIHGELVTF